MEKEKLRTNYLNAADAKMKELVAMFEEKDKTKTLLLIAMDDCSDGSSSIVAGLVGNSGNIALSLSKVLVDENCAMVLKEAFRMSDRAESFSKSEDVILGLAKKIIESRK